MRLTPFALALAALSLSAPEIASAHAQLVASTPAANASVRSPAKIELRFNEVVNGAIVRAEVAMTAMPGMGAHAPMPISGFTMRLGKDRKSLTLQLGRPLSAGTYRVTWSAAGADKHRRGGNFSFTVG